MQFPATQHPPPLQVFEAQQGWPAAPHTGPAAPPAPVPVPGPPPELVPVAPPFPLTEASLLLIDDVLLPHAATTNDRAEAITSAGNAPMPLERSD